MEVESSGYAAIKFCTPLIENLGAELVEKAEHGLPKSNVCRRPSSGGQSASAEHFVPSHFQSFLECCIPIIGSKRWSLHLGQRTEQKSSAKDSGLFCITPPGCSQTSDKRAFIESNQY
jgi:hypothetical protein